MLFGVVTIGKDGEPVFDKEDCLIKSPYCTVGTIVDHFMEWLDNRNFDGLTYPVAFSDYDYESIVLDNVASVIEEYADECDTSYSNIYSNGYYIIIADTESDTVKDSFEEFVQQVYDKFGESL